MTTLVTSMEYKYGVFTENQMSETKKKLRNQIFFLLLIVDNKTKKKYSDVNVDEAFGDLLRRIGGMNKLLSYPSEVVMVSSLLEAALTEYHSPEFRFSKYRKLILDAGAEVQNIKEV